ncbi:YybH family protein [Flagellimonas sp.]|uniref:YybH family protein n=1 Tax=Flagellimonas sp. TaxID=2058762 RepID=UPI003B5A30FB
MRAWIALAILFFMVTACKQEIAEPLSSDGSELQQKQAIKTTLVAMWDAIEKGDVERYASYVHPNFTQFGETDSILRIGKEAEVKGVTEWVKNSEGIHTEMEEPLITVKSNVAWITYYWRDKGITNGVPFTSRGKSTRIFVKENGRWLCIHGHYTLL